MYNKTITNLFAGHKTDHDVFHDLMKYRVRKILLVASLYDAFILQGEGSLYEQIYGEYDQLNLSSVPGITSVDNEEKAIEKLENEHFDLVLLMEGIHLENPERLSRRIRGANKTIPILLLLNNSRVATFLSLENRPQEIDRIFVWNGDAKIFLAMIKYIEDKHNLERDTRNGEVRVILLIEDSIPYYSRYIPILYTEIMQQTQYLMNKEKMDGMNKLLRMRARPKVILVSTYEDAEEIYNRYRESMLCVISDVEYMKNGKSDDRAGIQFITHLKKDGCDVPFLLQSSAPVDLQAENLHGVSFINKNSSELAAKLKKFIKRKLGFGEFIFRDRDGREVARANTIDKFTSYLMTISHETLLHHTAGNDFSTWLMARGEIHFAKEMRRMKSSDFDDIESIRDFMVSILNQVKSKNRTDLAGWFDRSSTQEHTHLVRISTGSLGGKGRGIAFSNSLIERLQESDEARIKVTVPDTAIIGTDEFEIFMTANSIAEIVERDEGYLALKEEFLHSLLSSSLVQKMRKLIKHTKVPLAVRSSGLFEDMLSQPCAGIYDTFILPNNDPDESVRLQQLTDAIKLIYCSIFSPEARAYFEAVNYKIEEEKMAVIIQKAVGNVYDGVFYPLISGTAQSFNYYPFGDFKPEDGICALAVGMGNYVVDGGQAFQFSPSNPKKSLLPADSLRGKTQKFFQAIDMSGREIDLISGEESCYSKLDISEAERHGNLMQIASTFDINNGRIVPGIRKKGPRIINYANILQYGKFPLAETIDFVLKLGEYALNTPVEIEFAVTFDPVTGANPLFHLLQLKPVIQSADECVIDRESIEKKNLFLYSEKSMGNGRLETIKDIVFVNPDLFDKTETTAIAEEVEKINKILKQEGKEYILIGPGRWGTRDRFLGIPVHFSQISSARVIVEAGLENFEIDASLGSHFFHNITSMNIGYSNIPWLEKESFIDWDWINQQRIVSDLSFVRHIELKEPCTVVMDGKKRLLIIEK